MSKREVNLPFIEPAIGVVTSPNGHGLEATVGDLVKSSGWLQRAASNAKLSTVLLFRLVKVWRDVTAQMESYNEALKPLMIEYLDDLGENFKSLRSRSEYEAKVKALHAEVAVLPHVTGRLPYQMISDNNKDAKTDEGKLLLSAADMVALEWLVEFPEE